MRGFAERNAINAPIQGSAADMIKIAMIRIHHEMNKQKMKSKMLLQVHDELVFDAHHSELENLKSLVENHMKNALPLKVPVEVGVGSGKNWLEAHCASGNYFEEQNLLICRLDQLSRNLEFQDKIKNTEWDLIIVDEAHKLSANYYGSKVNKTQRFLLGELLGTITRHFLLMTATPHNGKEEDFQIWRI